MKIRKVLLAIILLSLSFCFVSGAGYGEIDKRLYESKATFMDFSLLAAEVSYIMTRPDDFLVISFHYDRIGLRAEDFPLGVRTIGKIIISIKDTRNILSNEAEWYLLRRFEIELVYLYSLIKFIATDMNTDVVACLYSSEAIPLAYFYQGEYHLWEE